MMYVRNFLFLLFVSILLKPSHSQAMGKEFITSCTYGVIAGTIVGSATLAFADNPGDKLHRIARGASLGLYAGIMLGFYVTYGVSDVDDDPLADEYASKIKPPNFMVFPTSSEKGIDGIAATWNAYSF